MIQNGIPSAAIITEGLLGAFMLLLAFSVILRYRQKQTKITYYLALAFVSFAFAAGISAVGKYIDFNSALPRSEQSYTDFTIAIAYCFLTLGNVFYTTILKTLYLEEDSQLPLYVTIGNGIVIGLVLTKVSFENNVYDSILPFLVMFIFLSLIIHGTFFSRSMAEAKIQDSRVSKAGFQMISAFSLAFIMVIVFFLIDLVWGIIRDEGFTLFYYIGWITVGISTLCGYLGFLMPNRFRSLFS